MKKLKKEMKGITLVALVVTIIVLLILAGIAINLTVGNNGLFTRAKNAANTWRRAEINEREEMQSFSNTYDEVVNNLGLDGNEEKQEPIEKKKSYVGYYADIEGDGEVDGIIYIDQAISKTGTWENLGSGMRDSVVYEIIGKENLKEYYISKASYKGNFYEEEKPVITPVEGSEGEDRFYVMSLEDIKDASHNNEFHWYYSGGNGSSALREVYYPVGEGPSETKYGNSAWSGKWWGAQNAGSCKDLWSAIKEEMKQGWFLSSRAEWAAFGGELGITQDNYKSHSLSDSYWTSSLYTTEIAYCSFLQYGDISGNGLRRHEPCASKYNFLICIIYFHYLF